MDRDEAGAIADVILAELRVVPYDQLVDRLVGEVETRTVAGRANVEYQVEIHAMWDDPGAASGDLRVMVGVDDGTFRGAFRPVVRDVVVARDGTVVGE